MFKCNYSGNSCVIAVKLYIPVRIQSIIKKQKNQLNKQFRDMLEALSTSLGAGKNVIDSFRSVYDDMKMQYEDGAYIISELELLLSGMDNNIDIEDLLLDFGERSGNEDIESFAKVFQICYRKGGNIKDTVRSTYEILNDKMEIAEDIETVVTANKTEQNVMLIMPIGLIGMMKLMSPDFAENFVSPSGIMATTVAVIISVAAFYRKKSIGDKDLVMFGILDYICWILGLIFTIFWIFLFCKGRKNATLFQGLDEKEYPLKDIYFVGYELLELIKYNYRTKYDRRLRKEISVLKDGKYADYYIRVTKSTAGYFRVYIIYHVICHVWAGRK